MEVLVTGHDQFDRSMKKRSTEIEINHQTLISILPEHIIIDHILPRIPVKSLFRFKCVCQLWNSIISSSEFVESQLKFSSLCPQFVVLSEDYCSDDEHFKLFLLPCDGNNNNLRELIRLDLDHNWDFTILDIVGSCNGLLCLYLEVEKKYGHFLVWNPVTRQCREIRNPDGEDFALEYGFGYVSSTDDYKIVVLFSARNVGFGGFYVFSLRSGEWKRIDSLDNVTIVINDTLYWALNHMKDWQMVKCIVGLDLVDEKLKEIPWMNFFNQYSRVDFFVMRERVSLHCCGDHGSDVWALRRYGEWSSWEKLFSVKLGGMSFLNFTETGKCLVKSSDQLKVVDPSQDAPVESQEGARFSGRISGTAVYVESFISPFVQSLENKPGLSKSIKTHDLRIG